MKILKNKHALTTTAAIFAVVCATAYLNFADSAQADGKQGHAQMQVPQVPAYKIEPQDVQIWKSFSGRTKAVDIVQIRPQVEGTITKVNFKDGQNVKKGDLLFVIDPRKYQAEVNKLKADLKAAENQEENAKRNFFRAQELRKTSTVSQSNFEDRQTAYIVSQANKEAIKAQLDIAKVNLDYAYVKSPITGKVNRAEITLGNLVSANGDILTTIVSDKEMYVDFEVDEQTYLTAVRSESKDVPVKVKSLKDTKYYEGKVSSIDNQIDTSSGTVRARAEFKNEDQALVSGMFVNVEVGMPVLKNQVLIPETAIGTNQSRKFVYVINEGKVEYRDVTLGELVGAKRIIKKGLKENDIIIKSGLIKFRPGMPIKPTLK
jgi:multidrug efflux system membrane fusion protein